MSITEDNRRRFFRHQFGSNLCAEIRIINIGEQLVDSKKAYVCVRDIGAGGLRFESHLYIPPRDDVILEVSTIICDKPIIIHGMLKRTQTLENGYFQYGMEFLSDDDDSKLLLRLINELSVKSHKSTLPTGCSMCSSYTKCHKNLLSKKNEEKWSR
ncbi:PilZ domain-containing protein [Brevibacillus sp. NPDC058079]|uniref:PilZ domain-containing protein n=1 Tax=Brevibacillus sp. NPDC058079 TaxID=3346330 RepID=UPI0036EB40F5